MTRRPVWRLAPLLMLASCTGGHGGGSGPCQVAPAATFELKLQNALLFVPVNIQGSTVQALLDTGAEKSAVTSSIVTKLQLLDDRRNGTLMSGVGGLGIAHSDALIEQFSFAGYRSDAGHFAVIDDPKLATKVPDFGAIIGADFLENFDLDLDEQHRRLTVYRVTGACSGHFLPWTEPYTALPLDTTSGGRLLLPVRIDGVKLTALLDTGATSTFVDSDAAEKVGVGQAALGHDPNARGSGAAGVDFTSTLHQFKSLDVGPDHFDKPSLTVLDRSMREADMLLGEDYLRVRHVWISYRTSQMFVSQPAK